MLYHIPIEPYKTRYTADWIQQFESEFKQHNVDFVTVLGPKTNDTVSSGGVLDSCSTYIYKFSQLSQIIELILNNKIHEDDILFFSDLWFPGLESLFYIRNMLKIKFKIAGVFHAGTYDPADFTCRNGMRNWGKFLESCWFEEIDDIFLATSFHKELLLKNSYIDENVKEKFLSKLHITGLPFYAQDLRTTYMNNTTKEDIIVFPHRLDTEKHPELFDKLEQWLTQNNINCKCIKTIESTKSREEYFKLLARSKVMISFADQETFGYSTLESMALDNIVIVPNKLSYVETVPSSYRYNTIDEAFKLVKQSILNYTNPNYDLSKWKNSISNMIDILYK